MAGIEDLERRRGRGLRRRRRERSQRSGKDRSCSPYQDPPSYHHSFPFPFIVPPGPGRPRGSKGNLSAAGRAAIVAAQKARWAKRKAGKAGAKPVRRKNEMSAAGRAAIRAAVKARWAKINAAKAGK